MTTLSQNLIHKPYTFTDGRVKYPPPQALTATIATHEDEPTCYSQASKNPEWRVGLAIFDTTREPDTKKPGLCLL